MVDGGSESFRKQAKRKNVFVSGALKPWFPSFSSLFAGCEGLARETRAKRHESAD
jgi:hypothetical protein